MQSTLVQGKRRSSVLSRAGLLLVASATASFGTAQTSTPRRTVWEGAYTEAQAVRGMTAFGQSCAGCHVLAAEGKAPLVGDSFWKSFAQTSVGDLLQYVSANMPNGKPGSLSESTYTDLVALILKSNGFPAGTTELGSTTCRGSDSPQGRKYRAARQRTGSRSWLSGSERSGLGGYECDKPRTGGTRWSRRRRRNKAPWQP